jgi:hypothetical protein
MRKFLLCVSLLLTGALVSAQTNTGVITGTVTDSAGAVVAGAAVAITNLSTGASLAFTTNGDGYYTSAPIDPGTYSVAVTKSGFQSQTQTGLTLQVQARLAVNFTLTVGQVSQQVVVTGGAQVIDTQTSSLGQVLSSSTIEQLPLNGRSYLQLAALGTGVVLQSMGRERQGTGRGNATSSRPGDVSFGSNGTRSRLNNFILDGIDNNSNDNGALVVPSQVDALQEFKTQTSSYSAEFGRAGGAVINAVTKSGTNAYHGDVFFFDRPNALEARDFFQTPALGRKASYTEKQYGATIGGFLVRNKFFWFGDYQGTAINAPKPITSSVPSAAEKTGDFTGDDPIYDPTTQTIGPDLDADGNPVVHRRTFADEYGNGNVIPRNLINPIGQAFVNLYPDENVAGQTSATGNNYTIDPPAPYRANQGDVRFDFDPSQNNQAFFRYSLGHISNVSPQRFPGLAQGQSGSNVSMENMGASLGETHIFSPTVFNEFRLGFNYYGGYQEFPSYGIHYPPPELTIPGVPLFPQTAGLAQFSPNGFQGLGMEGDDPTYLSTEERQVTDALSLIYGKHSIVVGFEMRWSEFNLFQINDPNGNFSFGGEFTGPGDGSGVNGLADALMGFPDSADYNTLFNAQNRVHTPAAFFQDDYRITPKLTLNIGLRYDYFSPVLQKHDQQSNFNFQTGQIEVAGKDGNSRGLTKVDHLNLAPRLGFAWTIRKNTVLSAGGGIFFRGQETAEGDQPTNNLPFSYNPTFPTDGVTPSLNLSAGVPPFDPSQQPINPGVTTLDARMYTPYYDEWNLSIQQALRGGMSLQLAYAGSRGTHLKEELNFNQDVTPGPGDIQARRPYPFYGDFDSVTNNANSQYNSFQAKVEKRAGNGLFFLSSFTWSKMYDTAVAGYPSPQNAYDPGADYGLSDLNQNLRWSFAYDYVLPFGKGRRFASGANTAVNEIIGGWHFGGIYTLGSGFNFSPSGSGRSNTGATGSQRPDQVLPEANLPRGQRSIHEWFNKAAFQQAAQYTFGDAGRGILIGPDTNDFDFSLDKDFPIRESQHAEFRAEVFNALNHPLFSLPNASVTSHSYGTITTTGLYNREIQLAVKYYF